MARLKTTYTDEIRPALKERFGYTSVMQVPKIEKIVLNMGVGEAKQDSKMLEAAQEQLATIAGQRPNVRLARKSIANFKLRDGMPVGLSVTLRHERAYEFLDRLLSIAIPRIRDFRGLKTTSFDGRGNYTIGVREQIIFPEIDYDKVDQVRGLDVTITTTAKTDEEAFALLQAFGMPFTRDGRGPGEDAGGPGGGAVAPAEEEPAAEEPVADEPAAEGEIVEEPAAEAEPETADEEPAEEPVAEEPEPEAVEESEAVAEDGLVSPEGELPNQEAGPEDPSEET